MSLEEELDKVDRDAIENLAPGALIILTVSEETYQSNLQWIDKHELKIISEERTEYLPHVPDDIRKWNIKITVMKKEANEISHLNDNPE